MSGCLQETRSQHPGLDLAHNESGWVACPATLTRPRRQHSPRPEPQEVVPPAVRRLSCRSAALPNPPRGDEQLLCAARRGASRREAPRLRSSSIVLRPHRRADRAGRFASRETPTAPGTGDRSLPGEGDVDRLVGTFAAADAGHRRGFHTRHRLSPFHVPTSGMAGVAALIWNKPTIIDAVERRREVPQIIASSPCPILFGAADGLGKLRDEAAQGRETPPWHAPDHPA